MSGWNITTKEAAATQSRRGISMPRFCEVRPNMANATPTVLTSTNRVSATISQPGFTTMLVRVKMANVMSVIGAQILSASYMVRMNETLAMRAETAAVSEVGGDSSPHTDSKNTKKWATQGSMPSFFIGGTITTAPMM